MLCLRGLNSLVQHMQAGLNKQVIVVFILYISIWNWDFYLSFIYIKTFLDCKRHQYFCINYCWPEKLFMRLKSILFIFKVEEQPWLIQGNSFFWRMCSTSSLPFSLRAATTGCRCSSWNPVGMGELACSEPLLLCFSQYPSWYQPLLLQTHSNIRTGFLQPHSSWWQDAVCSISRGIHFLSREVL